MGKRYDAEEVAGFISALERGVHNYNSHAQALQANYKAYIANNEFRGELAEASKKYISSKHMQFHNGAVWIQQKILNIYSEIESYFKETVDRSDKARIDTGVLITIKKDFCIYRNVVDVHGGAIESKAAWLQGKFGEFHSFTQPNYNKPRKAYDDFCGNGKFLDQCLKKFRDFDSEICDYVDRTGFEDIVEEHRDEMKKTSNVLNTMTIQYPDVDKVLLSSLSSGPNSTGSADHKDTANMTEDEKVDLWLSPDYKLSDEEIKEALEICNRELSKIEIEPSNIDPVSDEDKAVYERYGALRMKCDKFSSMGTGFVMPFFNLGKLIMDFGEEIVGTVMEMMATGWCGYGSDFHLRVLGLRDKYAENTQEATETINKQKANAITQNPDEYVTGYIMGQATAYYITQPVFGAVASSANITSEVGQFMVNQIGQNWQDIMIDTNALYEELNVDGEISASDRNLLIQNVLQNATMNLAFAEAEALVDVIISSKAPKSLAEIDKIGQSADGFKSSSKSADKIYDSVTLDLIENIKRKTPEKLLEEGWEDITDPRMAQNTDSLDLFNPETGTKIRYDKGIEGATGYESVDHYHIYNNNYTNKKVDYYIDGNGNAVGKGTKASHIVIESED